MLFRNIHCFRIHLLDEHRTVVLPPVEDEMIKKKKVWLVASSIVKNRSLVDGDKFRCV